MRINIRGISDRGVPNKERLILDVSESTNLSFYAVFHTFYMSYNKIKNIPRNTYWFSPKEVRGGDIIVLYTGGGIDASSINEKNTTTHFFHWGLDKTIWNNKGDCAVLVEILSWQASVYE